MAQLKALVKTLEGLKPEEAAMYTQEGESFVLDTERYFHGMSSARDKEKQEAQRLRDMLKPYEDKFGEFKDMGVDELKEALRIRQEHNDKKMIDAGKVDELVEQKTTTRTERLRADYEGKISSLTKERDGAVAQLSSLLIDNAVQSAATKASVLPEALEDVSYRASKVFRVSEGKAIPMKGDEIIYGKDGKTPITMDEWMEDLKTKAPHFFRKPEGSGTRPGAGGGSRPDTQVPAGLIGVERLKAARRQK